MCTCKDKMKMLIENHKKRLCFENVIFCNPQETRLNIICSEVEKIKIVDPIITKEIITDFIEEIKKEIIENIIEPMSVEQEEEEEDDTVELTDIYPCAAEYTAYCVPISVVTTFVVLLE